MKASDVMTRKVITTVPSASVAQAARLMVQQRISGLPVVDADGAVVGMVTQGDLLRRVEIGTDRTRAGFFARLFAPGQLADEYVHTHSARVGDVMTGDIVSAAPSTPLAEIVALLQAHQVRRLPIVEQGRLVGIVSRADLLKALLQPVSAESAQGVPSDSAIRQRILERIHEQSWAPTACIDVKVESGIAELCGVFMDGRERQALRVLAETTPGVKAVRDRLVWIEPISGTLIDIPELQNY
jgi:CBS domain-containing protein